MVRPAGQTLQRIRIARPQRDSRLGEISARPMIF